MIFSNKLSILNRSLILVILLLAIPLSIFSQKKIPVEFCIDNTEMKMFELINQLRSDYGKTELQISVSLSYVAALHVDDLQTNNPDTSVCNLSSWSEKGDWTPCCYTKYLHNPDCMWDKPKELTPYTYRGYELVTFAEDKINIDSIIEIWSDSKKVLDMILTRGDYNEKKWICAGIGISDNYLSLWFGQRKDNLKSPIICDTTFNNTETIPVTITTNKTSIYYLIFGSYQNLHDAKTERKRIKDDNFKNCNILEKNNKYRVFLDKYGSMKEAIFAKQKLPIEYRGAWILKD